ncbi:transcriptional regulator [Enterococcus florum]|uniref:Transcriptional regulator n=1 Tax=Enterococcus florum TaxID=2480627 RepID=A0A4P5PCV4_9ENTE|nr:MarR family transcriptional regulator [Enterococcus florum]GCF94364.1 transcriptional regulator [Enterococcus florum]
MSTFTDDLMKRLRFVSAASGAFMSKKQQRLTGQLRVLAILEKEDGLIQSQLAEILDIRPSSLAELLKKMENNGDILRKEEENDRRIKRVFLTDQGREKVASLNGEADELSEAFFAGLTEEERKEFLDLLGKIADGWEEEFQKQADRFVDPMDRLRQMQDFRQQFEGFENWHTLSREERRQLKDKMRKEMGHHPFFGPGHGPGRGHGGPGAHDFPRGPHKDFRRDFWEKDFPGNPYDQGKDQPKEDDEWQDF